MAVNLEFNPQNAGQAADPAARALARQQYAPAASDARPQDANTPKQTSDSVQISSEAAARSQEAQQYAEPKAKVSDKLMDDMQDTISGMRENVQQLADLASQAKEAADATQTGNAAEATGSGAAQQERDNGQSSSAAEEATETPVVEQREEETSSGSARTGQNTQEQADRQLSSVAEAGKQLQRQQEALAEAGVALPSGAGMPSELSTLGVTQDENGNTVSLGDLATGGKVSLSSDTAQKVIGQAATDLAQAGTQLENYRSLQTGGGAADISGAEDLLNTDTAGDLTESVAQAITNYDSAALYEAAAANISGTRALDLLA